MRYAGYDDYETVNGNGGGMSIYVQGCHEPHCYNCFNPETWDFNGGKEWTEETKNKFLELADRPYIKRISLLGGECLAEENLDGVLDLVTEINKKFNSQKCDSKNIGKTDVLADENHDRIRLLYSGVKTIWLYTGFTWESLFVDEDDPETICQDQTRRAIILSCDVLVDGKYIDSLRNPSLAFRGSENQRIIDIQKSIKKGEVVLWQL